MPAAPRENAAAGSLDHQQARRSAMSEVQTDKPVMLIKKLGGMILLVLGCALTAAGFSMGYQGLAMAGIGLLALGVLLLVLKILRRNQGA
jgi:predicted phage tail protein